MKLDLHPFSKMPPKCVQRKTHSLHHTVGWECYPFRSRSGFTAGSDLDLRMTTQLLELQRGSLSKLLLWHLSLNSLYEVVQYQSLQMYASGRCLESLDVRPKAHLNFNICRNGVSLPYIYSEDKSVYLASSSSGNARARVNSPMKGDRNKCRSDQRVHNTL